MSSIMGDVGNACAATPKRLKSTEGSTAAGRKKRGTCVCPICNESIVDGTKNKKGQDAIFCEGVSDSFLHRRCAGLSQTAFAELQNSTETFHCPHRQLKMCKLEICNLRQTVKSLQASVACLESKLVNPLVQSVEQKFNLVIKGINESKGGTTRSARNKCDFNEAFSVLSNLDSDIHQVSVREYFHLGRFKEHSRYPHPILVKLTHSTDAHSILSQRSNLPEGVVIKPDMSAKE